MGDFILTGRGWDLQMESLLKESEARNAGRVAIEVGANIGASLIPVCGEFPGLEFHLYEPVPEFLELLQKNRESYGADNAHLHSCAISDRSGSLVISCGLGNAGAVLVAEDEYARMEVPCQSLDEMHCDSAVGFVKIDVDGYEWNVLQGGRNLLGRCRPDVFLEFNVDVMDRMGVRPDAMLDILADASLREYRVYDNFGAFMETTSEPKRVIELARGAPYYVDILARERGI